MKNKIRVKDLNFEVMITAAELDKAVSEVAQKINQEYANVEEPIFLGVLNGSFMFMSDLMKKIDFESELSFVKVASYEGTESVGEVKTLIGLNDSIKGRHIIIVEDIVDSGNSIEHLTQMLAELEPASVKICTLFFKPNAYQKQIPIDYVALEIGNEFIVGYGLDYDQLGRNLKDIYVVCNE